MSRRYSMTFYDISIIIKNKKLTDTSKLVSVSYLNTMDNLN